jgi:hypothetical protein
MLRFHATAQDVTSVVRGERLPESDAEEVTDMDTYGSAHGDAWRPAYPDPDHIAERSTAMAGRYGDNLSVPVRVHRAVFKVAT